MKFEDALKLMKEGKKIRKKRWRAGNHMWLDENKTLKNQNCNKTFTTLEFDFMTTDEWEIYEEPILDKQEKKYLENFLRPYTKRFGKITITKAHFCSGDFSIVISFFAFKDDDYITDNLSLPYFSKSEHMYDGMESDKSYTLEELGLFEEEWK